MTNVDYTSPAAYRHVHGCRECGGTAFEIHQGPCRPYLLCAKCTAPQDDFDIIAMDQLLDEFTEEIDNAS